MDDTEDLIGRARRGDGEAREALMARHLDGLHAFVRLRLGAGLRRRETSLDLVQSVCREVLEDLDGFEYRGGASFRHWLFRRAETKIRGRARFWGREKRDAGREERLGDEPSDQRLLAQLASFATPSRHLGTREEIERIERAFASLSEEHREVIRLARVAGLPHALVAREMGRTPAATRTLLSRALARLATRLEQDD